MNIELSIERQSTIRQMKNDGNTFTSIGKKFKLTKQACHQIYHQDLSLSRKFPRRISIIVDGEVKNLLTRY